MLKLSKEKYIDAEVGDIVCIPIPDVDQACTDLWNILGVPSPHTH